MKKILFILRDFEPRQNFTRIKEQLHEDMREIWKGLVKEEKYEQSDVEEFFSIEYKYLPSFVYAEEQFKEDVKLLKKKFEKSSEESIFIKREEQNLPMDGIPIYFTNIWELIRSQKDLNLVISYFLQMIWFSLERKKWLQISCVMDSNRMHLMTLN
jgi:hypothetical protein